MKTFLLLILCLACSTLAMGQEPIATHRNVDEVQVTPPKFVGESMLLSQDEKNQSIDDYLKKHVTYPEENKKDFIQGIEVVRFVVTTDGKLTDFNVINSISQEMDDEVIRVLLGTDGMWMAGQNNDRLVDMEKEVSVIFKLSDIRLDFIELGKKYFKKGAQDLFVNANPQKALKHYNKAALYVPNDISLLLLRGIALYETGDTEGAIRDWERIKSQGDNVSDAYLTKVKGWSGYDALTYILNREE